MRMFQSPFYNVNVVVWIFGQFTFSFYDILFASSVANFLSSFEGNSDF